MWILRRLIEISQRFWWSCWRGQWITAFCAWS